MRARSIVVLTMTGRVSAAQFTGPLSFAVRLGKHAITVTAMCRYSSGQTSSELDSIRFADNPAKSRIAATR
jgi:hypothetical protein